jgi:hypothetical protein
MPQSNCKLACCGEKNSRCIVTMAILDSGNAWSANSWAGIGQKWRDSSNSLDNVHKTGWTQANPLQHSQPQETAPYANGLWRLMHSYHRTELPYQAHSLLQHSPHREAVIGLKMPGIT